jgi:hypothetical protein
VHAEDNKRYFAKLGGIPRLLKLMGPGNHHEVRIKATKAVWNFASTEELQRLLLGEGTNDTTNDTTRTHTHTHEHTHTNTHTHDTQHGTG